MAQGVDQGWTAAYRLAMELVGRGERAQAEALLANAVADAARESGERSAAWARANHELGILLAGLGSYERAVAVYREACRFEDPVDARATRDRLTYMLNLGDLLIRTGLLDEAERLLRRGLAGREAFYGRQHAGWGFGLEPLVELLLRRGDLDEALDASGALVANFWSNAHPRVAEALALRCEILRSREGDASAFDDLEGLPEPVFRDMVAAVITRAESAPGERGLDMLEDLLAAVTFRLGAQDDAVLHVQTAASHIARAVSAERHVQALRALLGVCRLRDVPREVIRGLQRLARGLADRGEPDDHAEALDTWREALERAEASGSAPLLAEIACELGLHLAEVGEEGEAEQTLRRAVEVAAASAESKPVEGRCAVALGVFLQHQGHAEEARALLSRALEVLHLGDPDALRGRTHLAALEEGAPCGCRAAQADPVTEALWELVEHQLPEELLDDVTWDAEGGVVHLRLLREPTPEERALVERVTLQAQDALRERLARG